MIQDLYEIAKAFRVAIEEAVSDNEIPEMSSFPRGCCSYASNLLQRYLIEQYGFFTWYMSGKYGDGMNGESHAWLETKDHSIVIDITGDQYKGKKLRFTEPVYVETRADGFHNKFKLDEPESYSRIEDPFVGNRDFDRRYNTVLRHL